MSILNLDEFVGNIDLSLNRGLFDKLNEKTFTVSDLEVAYRWISHWDKEGLLLSSSEEGKWRRFNFIEYCWIKIIVELRKYNISFNILRMLKDHLLISVDMMAMVELPEVVEEIIKMMPDAEYQKKAMELLKDKDLMRESLGELEISIFTLLVLNCILQKSHISILTDHEGNFFPVVEENIDKLYQFPEFVKIMHGSYISVSLTNIISEFIKSNELDVVNGRLWLLTENEAELLSTMRSNEKFKSIKITFDEKEEIDLLEITKTQKIDKSSKLVDIIMSQGYQDIEIKTQNGSITHYENTRKKKLSKS